MARDFSGATTDKVTTGLTAHNSTRSYALWTYRTGNGGGGYGRMFAKEPTSGTGILWYNNAGTNYSYWHSFSTTQGQWTIAIPSANVWHHLVLTYDDSATANNPIVYVDGNSVSVTRAQGPAGTASTNASAYVIGNRGLDAREWGGRLAEFAIWDSILGANQAMMLASGRAPWSIGITPLRYYPILGYSPEPDFSGNVDNATVTGTTIANHAPVGPLVGWDLGWMGQFAAAVGAAVYSGRGVGRALIRGVYR